MLPYTEYRGFLKYGFLNRKIKRDYPSEILFGLRFIEVTHQLPRFGCIMKYGDVISIHKHHI